MAWLYPWATREYCLYRLTFDQLLVYWREGRINQKMQALRIAGHMWGTDVDKVMDEPEEEGNDWFKKEFGCDYAELFEE
jgi:hypothetical protein